MEIITARQAFDLGLKRYFTGKPCGNGHIAERMVANGTCHTCLSLRAKLSDADKYERVKTWRLQHPEARTEEARKYRIAHPDKVKATQQRYQERNVDAVRERNRDAQRRIRNINPGLARERSLAYRDRQQAKQEVRAGRPRPAICDICADRAIGRIVFDHCHTRGHFRGWLCDRCNKVLGLLKDDPNLLRGMAAYLEKSDDEAHSCHAQGHPHRTVRASGKEGLPG